MNMDIIYLGCASINLSDALRKQNFDVFIEALPADFKTS